MQDNASPTLLNNIVMQFETGIDIDSSSETTVIGGTLYKDNDANVSNTNVGEGSFVIQLDTEEVLFVNRGGGNYYLNPGTEAIDSSINTLEDRAELTTVKEPLGISPSPIHAPDIDISGQKRVDDPEVSTPTGLGQNTFKDRGAVDRSDFSGPTIQLVSPEDNDALGLDRNPALTEVELRSTELDYIELQLIDGLQAVDLIDGSGIDASTVNGTSFSLSRDGELMTLGKDYNFAFHPNNNLIRFTPVKGKFESDKTYTISVANRDGFLIKFKDGSQTYDGNVFELEDLYGNHAKFEFESGYSIYVEQSYTFQVPEEAGEALIDGEQFRVTVDGETTLFELDRNNQYTQDAIPIRYTLNSAQATVADNLTSALREAGIGLTPRNLGMGQILVGGTSEHVLVNSASSLPISGIPSSVNDGDVFVLTVDGESRTFEFDVDGMQTLGTDHVVEFEWDSTYQEIASEISEVINDAEMGIETNYIKDGLVHVGGEIGTLLDTTESKLIVQGTPGTRSGYGIYIESQDGVVSGIIDGQTFSISDGLGNTAVFEFDNNSEVLIGNNLVEFQPAMLHDTLGQELVSAINDSELDLIAVYLGDGNIQFHNTTDIYSMDLLGTVLSQTGEPGDPGAYPVYFVPNESFTMAMMIESAQNSVNAADTLVDVFATVRSDGLLVSGVGHLDNIENNEVLGVKDLAANRLQGNQQDGSNQFTVVLSSGLDYGDAPDPDYPTLEKSGGAQHFVVDGFHLGEGVDTEPEANTNEDATGDGHDDGVVFVHDLILGGIGTLEVTATGIDDDHPGFLDGWFDFDADGRWDDGDQIFDTAVLQEGVNILTFDIPNDANIGNTFARFRLSGEGQLTPTGFASEGEVEDYPVEVKTSPWRNPFIAEDVNMDGFVSPIDALLVINYLNITDPAILAQALPVPEVGNEPPPFLDVNGDSMVAPLDALMVINKITESLNAGAEGEFVPEVASAMSRTSVGTLTVVHDTAELQQVELERAREQQFRELGLNGINPLEDVLSDIADDVQASEADDLDDFFANIRFE